MLIIPFLALLGWFAGAATNYLADVLPARRRLSHPFCLTCGENFGLLNYLVWPRKCGRCGRLRTGRAWLVELAAIGAVIWLWFSPPSDLAFPASLALLMYFGLVVVIDMEHRLILHPVSLAGGLLCLVLGAGAHRIGPTLLGGAAGIGVMLFLYWFGILLLRMIQRAQPREDGQGSIFLEEALGFGDVILGGVLGLLLGWPGIVLGLILAILIGGAVSLVYLLAMLTTRRYRPGLALPYGPFLVASGFILIFFKEIIFRYN